MERYRVECNFGCKYFENIAAAYKYFYNCKKRHLDVELWLVRYSFDTTSKRYAAVQVLTDYSFTYLPKY